MSDSHGDHPPEREEFLAHAALYGELSDRFRQMRDMCTRAAGGEDDGGAMIGDAASTPFIGNTVPTVDSKVPAPKENKALRGGRASEIGDLGNMRGAKRPAVSGGLSRAESLPPKTLGKSEDGSTGTPKPASLADSADRGLPDDPRAEEIVRALLQTPQGCRRVADLLSKGKYVIKKHTPNRNREDR